MEVSSSQGAPLGTIRKPGDPAVAAPHRANKTVKPDPRHFTKTGRGQHCGLSAVYFTTAEVGRGWARPAAWMGERQGRGERRGGAGVGAGRASGRGRRQGGARGAVGRARRAPGAGRIRDWASAGDGAEPGAGTKPGEGASGRPSRPLGASSRCLVSGQVLPVRERHRRPGTAAAAAAALAGPDAFHAREGLVPQPPTGQCPRRDRNSVVAARAPGLPPAPGPPLVRAAREELRRRLLGDVKGPPRGHLQQDLLPAQHAGRRPGPRAPTAPRPGLGPGSSDPPSAGPPRSRLRPPTGRRATAVTHSKPAGRGHLGDKVPRVPS